MTSTNSTTSTGHAFSEASWLDIHFEVSRNEYEAMIRDVGLQPGWHVLDAGCGGGSFLPLMSELVGPTGRITALDLAPENVAIVEQRAAAGHFACAVETKVGAITELPFADNSFDAIWCANVVQYLTEAEFHQSAGEFLRVLRPGGLLMLKEVDMTAAQFGPLDPALIWRFFASWRKSNPTLGALYTLSFSAWLNAAGFQGNYQRLYIREDRHPLTKFQDELSKGAFPYLAELALNASDISVADKAVWREKVLDVNNPAHIMHDENFFNRGPYALILSQKPPA